MREAGADDGAGGELRRVTARLLAVAGAAAFIGLLALVVLQTKLAFWAVFVPVVAVGGWRSLANRRG